MGSLVLVRHGESRWNLCDRFTGWIDVPLSENGIKEAQHCAEHCKRFDYSAAFTSCLTRAQETLLIILSLQNRTGVFQHKNDPRYSKWIHRSNLCSTKDTPIFADVALNERYYGALQGMEKRAAVRKYGERRIFEWRRSYISRPPQGETLKEAHDRMHPYLVRSILPRVKRGEDVLVVAHGNTLRTAIKHLEKIPDDQIPFIDLPGAQPIVYEYRRGKFVHTEGEYRLDRPLR